jgi:hypothetical protein
MDELRNQERMYKKAIQSLNREKILRDSKLKVNTGKVVIHGLLVKFYSSEYNMVKKMVVKPEFIKLYYKISDGAPFDLTLWEELSQPEKNFLFQIISKIRPESERDIGERHRKEAKQFFNKLYVNENQIRIGNNSKEIFNELKDSISGLMDRHLITTNLGGRLIKQYQQAIGKINDTVNIEQSNI